MGLSLTCFSFQCQSTSTCPVDLITVFGRLFLFHFNSFKLELFFWTIIAIILYLHCHTTTILPCKLSSILNFAILWPLSKFRFQCVALWSIYIAYFIREYVRLSNFTYHFIRTRHLFHCSSCALVAVFDTATWFLFLAPLWRLSSFKTLISILESNR